MARKAQTIDATIIDDFTPASIHAAVLEAFKANGSWCLGSAWTAEQIAERKNDLTQVIGELLTSFGLGYLVGYAGYSLAIATGLAATTVGSAVSVVAIVALAAWLAYKLAADIMAVVTYIRTKAEEAWAWLKAKFQAIVDWFKSLFSDDAAQAA